MRLLLDSHALLGAAFGPETLSAAVRDAIVAPDNMVHVSAISPYELELKKSLGKLAFPDVADWRTLIESLRLRVLEINVQHGVTAARLPRHHKDPWDRLLVAQALVEGFQLVTKDRRLAQYKAATFW